MMYAIFVCSVLSLVQYLGANGVGIFIHFSINLYLDTLSLLAIQFGMITGIIGILFFAYWLFKGRPVDTGRGMGIMVIVYVVLLALSVI